MYFVQQSLLEKQQEFVEKLEEVCNNLTSTENHLIGHQQQVDNAESVTDLQQYQEEHQVWVCLLRAKPFGFIIIG